MRQLLIITLFYFQLDSCNETRKEKSLTRSEALVKLYAEDSLIELNNNFSLNFFTKTHQIHSHILRDSIFWETDENIKDGVFKVEFRKNSLKIIIDSIPGYLLINEMKANFVFGVDSFPFLYSKGHVLPEQMSSDYRYKKIIYLEFDPTENAIGRIFSKVVK